MRTNVLYFSYGAIAGHAWQTLTGQAMSTPPASPKIYHITHIGNLATIVAEGVLHCDATITARGGPAVAIGMSHIKRDRLSRPVPCHPGDMAGDYVPFNFCPRSVMLYLIHMANHLDLAYRGGQGPIVHIEADLHRVTDWADANGARWAFVPVNARAAYAQFYCQRGDLEAINWEAITNNNFRDESVKESKQAEFLMHAAFPWSLVVGRWSMSSA